MPTYWVTVNGENFLIDVDGTTEKCGFFTHRCVVADTPQEAWDAVASSLREDAKLRELVKNAADDRPEMNLEEIKEIDAIDPECPAGFIWYPMESPKRWWQFWK